MGFTGPILDVVQGSDFDQPYEAYDRMNRLRSGDFLDTDTFSASLWPAGSTEDDALAAGAAIVCSWINAPLAQWRLTVPGSVTAALPPGVYRLLVRVLRVDLTPETGTLLYAELRVAGAGSVPGLPPASPVPGLPGFDTLGRVPILWCTDEDIAIRCEPDFTTLLPASQLLAEGSDGSFTAADPWTLASPSNDFSRQLPSAWTSPGLAYPTPTLTPSSVGYVCHLRKPQSAFQAGGHLMATAAVNGPALTLRRLGVASNVGRSPAPASGLVGVDFRIATFLPQIEEATYEINQRWNIDVPYLMRPPAALMDIRPLRRLCVAMVLLDRYTDAVRSGNGNYANKIDLVNDEIDRLSAKLQLRWGGIGTPTVSNWFSTRVVR